MTSDKKVMKTKNLLFDEIYLQRGLFLYLPDPLSSLIVPGAAGFIFGGKEIKNPSKPFPKNLLRHPKLKKSLQMHIWPFK